MISSALRLFTSLRVVPLILLVIVIVPFLSIQAQLVNGRLTTSIYTWEKFDTVGTSETFVRGFESILLDASQDKFSLHTNVQFAATLKKTLDETPDYRIFTLYGKMQDIANTVDLWFGRLPYYAGAGTGTLDGAMGSARFASNSVRLTLYGGRRVPDNLEFNGAGLLKTNFAVGAQVITTSIRNTRVGLSYVSRKRDREAYWTTRPDSLYNPVTVYIEPEPLEEEIASADVEYRMDAHSIYGRYDYDVNREDTRRAQVGVHLSLTDALYASASYIHRAPRIGFNSFFSVFEVSSTDEFEAGADYSFTRTLRGSLRGAYVAYDEDQSFRYSAGVGIPYGSLFVNGTTGFAGDQTGFTVQGSYPFMKRMIIPNGSLSYISYRLNDNADWEHAFSIMVGATVRPIPSVSVDLQLQDVQNRIVDHDVRFLGKLQYWFAENLSLLD